MAKERGADVDDRDIDSEESTDDGAMQRGREKSRDAVRGREHTRKEKLVDEYSASDLQIRAATSSDLTKIDTPSQQLPETAAERKRRENVLSGLDEESPPRTPRNTLQDTQQERQHIVQREPPNKSPQEYAGRETPAEKRRREATAAATASSSRNVDRGRSPLAETPAEKRRREAALGMGEDVVDSDSDDDNTERVPQAQRRPGIRFAEEPIRGRK
jgi:hypothetical protein